MPPPYKESHESLLLALDVIVHLLQILPDDFVNIALISQTNDEINIIVGVHNDDYEKTINTIYSEFK